MSIPTKEFESVRVGKDGLISGFEKFDALASRNIPVWNAVTNMCRVFGTTEEVRLKMLAVELLRQNQEQQAQLVKYVQNSNPVVYL